MFDFEVVRLGPGAQTGCVRCGIPASAEHFPAADIISRSAALTSGNISIQGQEPLLHRELPTILETLLSNPVDRLHISTDGIGLSSRQVAAGLASSGVTWVSIRLLAPESEAHDALSGMRGSFDAVIAGISNLRAPLAAQGADAMLTGEIPVCSHNINSLPATVALFAEKGMRSVALDLSRLARSESAKAWVDSAVDTGLVAGMWVSLSDPEFLGAPDGSLAGKSPVRFAEVSAS